MTESSSTAVAPRSAPTLPPEALARIEERKVQNAVIQAIRGATWSKDMSAEQIRAIAMWSREHGLDAATEVEVLGGRPYITVRYYERVLSQLIARGLVEYARPDWVHVDARLDTLAAGGDTWAIAESARRTRERILHNLSDAADAACVFRIKPRAMLEEVTGAKQHVPGKKLTIKRRDGSGSFDKDADPVGDLFPSETIESRALRRAMLKLRDALPEARIVGADDDGAVEITATIAQHAPAPTPEVPQLPASSRGAYGEDAPVAKVRLSTEDTLDPYQAEEGDAA